MNVVLTYVNPRTSSEESYLRRTVCVLISHFEKPSTVASAPPSEEGHGKRQREGERGIVLVPKRKTNDSEWAGGSPGIGKGMRHFSFG